MKNILATIVLFGFVFNANAALIDNGDWTTDDINGLDWLDLSITDGQSYNLATSLNTGWSYATNTQVVDLFDQLFSGYYDTSGLGFSSSGYAGANVYAGYTDQNSDVDLSQELFGYTYINNNFDFSFGFFKDENGKLTLMGTGQFIDPLYPADSTTVYSPDYINDYAGFIDGHSSNGIYLVRQTSSVPEPSSLFLMSIGLLTLFGAVRKKGSA